MMTHCDFIIYHQNYLKYPNQLALDSEQLGRYHQHMTLKSGPNSNTNNFFNTQYQSNY